MNEQKFLDSLEKRLSGKSAREVKGRLMAVLLDMADEERTRQRKGAGRVFHCLHLRLSLLWAR